MGTWWHGYKDFQGQLSHQAQSEEVFDQETG